MTAKQTFPRVARQSGCVTEMSPRHAFCPRITIDDALAAKMMVAALFFDLDLDGRVEGPDDLMGASCSA